MSIQDEFNRQITDLDSAKMALGWAVERAQSLAITIQSLKEQLEQKNQMIKSLQKDNFDMQRDHGHTDIEKISMIQKVQTYQEEINTLINNISEKEKEKLDLQRKHIEEMGSMKPDAYLIWRNQLLQEFFEKQMVLTFEYIKKEIDAKARTESELRQTIQELQKYKSDLESRLKETEGKLQNEISKIHPPDPIEMEKMKNLLQAGFQEKEKSLLEKVKDLEQSLSEATSSSALAKQQDQMIDLEKKVKGLMKQAEYYTEYNKLLTDQRNNMEKGFSQLVKQVSTYKKENENEISSSKNLPAVVQNTDLTRSKHSPEEKLNLFRRWSQWLSEPVSFSPGGNKNLPKK